MFRLVRVDPLQKRQLGFAHAEYAALRATQHGVFQTLLAVVPLRHDSRDVELVVHRERAGREVDATFTSDAQTLVHEQRRRRRRLRVSRTRRARERVASPGRVGEARVGAEQSARAVVRRASVRVAKHVPRAVHERSRRGGVALESVRTVVAMMMTIVATTIVGVAVSSDSRHGLVSTACVRRHRLVVVLVERREDVDLGVNKVRRGGSRARLVGCEARAPHRHVGMALFHNLAVRELDLLRRRGR